MSRDGDVAAQGRKSSEEAWGTDAMGVVGEGWPDGSGGLAGASGEREAGPVGNDGRASDPSAAKGWRNLMPCMCLVTISAKGTVLDKSACSVHGKAAKT